MVCFASVVWMSVVTSVVSATPKSLQVFELEDHLNRAWQHELVFFDLADSNWVNKSLAVMDEHDQPQPFQVHTSNGKSQIALVVDLPVGGKRTFRLVQRSSGKQPANLNVRTDENVIELGNGRLGLRIAANQQSAKDGPLIGMRLKDGPWQGRGTLTSERKIVSYEAKVVNSGPLFVDVQSVYRFEDDKRWVIDFRLIMGEPVVLIEEKFDLADKSTWTWQMDRMGITHSMHRVSHVPTPRWRASLWLRQQGKKKANAKDQPEVLTLRPWVHWWRGDNAAAFTFYQIPEQVVLVRDDKQRLWLPADHQGRDVQLQVEGLAADADKQQDADIEEIASGSVKPRVKVPNIALVVGAGRASQWTPIGGGYNRGMTMSVDSEGTLKLQGKLDVAGRVWFVGDGSVTDVLKTDKQNMAADEMVLKFYDRPLNEVKDMVLSWPTSYDQYPRVMFERGQLEQLRANPPKMVDHASSPRHIVKSFTVDPQRSNLAPRAGELAANSAGSLAELFLDLQSRNSGFRRTCVGEAPHQFGLATQSATAMSDMMLGADVLTIEQKDLIRAQLAFVAYKLADPNVGSVEHGLVGLPNMITYHYAALATLACVLADHPMASYWTQRGLNELDRQLSAWAGPNGGWIEAPHYQLASMEQIIFCTLAAQRAGLSEMVYDERLKKAVLFLAKICTPNDPRFHNYRHLPPIGNTYLMETTNLFAMMATIHKDRDPEYAANMQWMWEQHGSPRRFGIGGDASMHWISDFMYSNIKSKAPNWQSELFPAFGAVLRNGYLSGRETYMVYHQCRRDSHYDVDQGSFELWAFGRPVSLDWGYKGRMPAHQHNRVNIGAAGQVLEFVEHASADYLHGRQSTWDRRILFAKDSKPTGQNYFVLHDSVAKNAGRAGNWWLWLYTSEHVSISGHTLLMRGNDDVDMLIAMPSDLAKKLPKLSKEQLQKQRADRPPESPDGVIDLDFELPEEGMSKFVKTTDLTIGGVVINTVRSWSMKGSTRQRGLNFAIEPGTSRPVVLLPKLRDQSPPKVDWLDGQRVLRVTSAAGVDYILMSNESFVYNKQQIGFEGEVGLIQIRGDQVTLTLSRPGRLSYQSASIETDESISKTFSVK